MSYKAKKIVFFMSIWSHRLGFWCKNNRNKIHCVVKSLRNPCHIVCAPTWQYSYILCKTTGALFYLKSVTDDVMLVCLTSESSEIHEERICEMCHVFETLANISSIFFKYVFDNLILTALLWTKTCEPQIKLNWNRSDNCTMLPSITQNNLSEVTMWIAT